jgi:hypothetical protein
MVTSKNFEGYMYLYKFRAVNEYSLNSLIDRQLWFDKLNNQNDPFEGGYIIDIELTEELLEYSRNQIGFKNKENQTDLFKVTAIHYPIRASFKELFLEFSKRRISELVEGLQNKSTICSLSQYREENNPLFNHNMWGHYSDGLRGFCLVFDEQQLTKNIFISSDRLAHPFTVEYRNSPKRIYFNNLLQVKNDQLQILEEFEGAQLVADITATKSSSWSIEQEIRFISFSKKQLLNYEATSLLKVIIGDKMEHFNREKLLDIITSNYPEAEILLMKKKHASFELYTVPLIV